MLNAHKICDLPELLAICCVALALKRNPARNAVPFHLTDSREPPQSPHPPKKFTRRNRNTTQWSQFPTEDIKAETGAHG
eukprot:313172-Rhodomonas_salina.5